MFICDCQCVDVGVCRDLDCHLYADLYCRDFPHLFNLYDDISQVSKGTICLSVINFSRTTCLHCFVLYFYEYFLFAYSFLIEVNFLSSWHGRYIYAVAIVDFSLKCIMCIFLDPLFFCSTIGLLFIVFACDFGDIKIQQDFTS